MKDLIWSSYERLCHPEQMGSNYKVLFLAEKSLGEVYPFLSEEEIARRMN